MTRRLVFAMAGLVVIVAIALAVPFASVVATDQRASFVSGLEVDTLSAASLLSAEQPQDWGTTVADVAAATGARVVVVGADKNLIADSEASALDRSFDRPEIIRALAGELASDVRSSATLGEELRFVAAPVVQDFAIVAAVRLTLPESIVDRYVQQTIRWLILFVLAVAVAAALVAWLLARSVASPLRRVADVARRLPEDLSVRADEARGPGEVRAVARALNTTGRRLGGIIDRTQRVAAEASHHLRTPLTGVRLRLEAIEETSDDPNVQADARAATLEVDRLAHRIEQVLALARADAGQEHGAVQDVSVIVADRIDAATPMFDERHVVLASSLEPGVRTTAPSGVLARIVDELLGNAVEYAASRVDVVLELRGTEVLLTVSDDGPGVPDAEQVAIFDRFRRGARAVGGGSGLGLALVSESVAALGGRVWAGPATSDSANPGLRVVVVLPATE